MKNLYFLILTLIVLIFSACKSKKVEANTSQDFVKHVILIGSDGFGAYAFNKAKVPNLRMMMKEGSYSLKARSVLPSSSAVNWASMIMGSGPELHGYTEWGSKTPELPSRVIGKDGIYPTIFSLLDKQMPNAKVGVSYTWGGIGYLFEKSIVDLNYNGSSDEKTIEKGMEFFLKEKPALMFIHLDHPDVEGHEIGHDTPEYYGAVEKVDSQIGGIITTLKKNKMMDNTVIIFTSDHGGVAKGHGGKTLLEVEIPWIVYGKNIVNGGKLEKSIVTYDTASTIAYLLGLKIPDFWRGVPIKEIVKP
ncbi:alkaline phosphatase [Aureibaculum sp. 2210JD6-5]|uniref:alkaline phosphatase n=1 Tax=Aureibaculum sp. 2210JD6-5 TaxID=3103957 RepID=UPI002AAD89D4|nr:alkaline phosphatase [Aureibaculum sp. 2210JD6-5]MDY7393979.1 alkaline phosphatase [Aureibaculum sp. 2210JD6-5]